jgi:hypothetical protein
LVSANITDVDGLRVVVHGDAGRDRSIEDACAIEVHRETAAVGHLAQRLVQAWRDHSTAAAIMRVLEAQQLGRRIVDVALADRRGHARRIQHASLARDRPWHQMCDAGQRADLVMHDVRIGVEDDLAAGGSVHDQRDEVGHVSADREHRRLLAHRRCGHGLEARDGRVVAVGVIAERRGRDCLEHRFCRQGLGVAAQVDRGHDVSGFLRSRSLR